MVFKGDDDEETLMVVMIVWQAGYQWRMVVSVTECAEQ